VTEWVPKPSAPATFDLASAFGAAITGDPERGWLTSWLPLLGGITVNTADFCAKGPAIGLEPLDPSDFNTSDRNPLATIANKVVLGLKLRDAAYDFMFAAYCQLPAPPPTEYGPDVCARLDPVPAPGAEPTVFHYDLPAGATLLRARCTAADSPSGSRVFYCQLWVGGGAGAPVHWNDFINPSVPTSYYVTGTTDWTWVEARNFDWEKGGTVCFSTDHAGPGGYEPVPQPEPPGVLAPVTRTYDTIGDLGRELDDQELKLDHVLAVLQWIAAQTTSPKLLEDLPETVGESVIAAEGAQGFVVRLSNVPPAISEDFPIPGRLHRAGWARLTSPHGHLPPISLNQVETVIAPVPPWVNGIGVFVYPPTTATVSRLRPTK